MAETVPADGGLRRKDDLQEMCVYNTPSIDENVKGQPAERRQFNITAVHCV